MGLFDKMEQKSFNLPRFLAEGHFSMPPQSGFSHIAQVMCIMKDELSCFRHELNEIRLSNQRDTRSFEDLQNVKQDITDIKSAVNSLVSRVPNVTSFPINTLTSNQGDYRAALDVNPINFPSIIDSGSNLSKTKGLAAASRKDADVQKCSVV